MRDMPFDDLKLRAADRLSAEPLSPFGLRIAGFDIAAAGPRELDALRDLLGAAGVVILTGAETSDAGFAAFLARLGEPMFTDGEAPVVGHPSLNVVTNVGLGRVPVSNWHSDTSYVARPPAFTALRPVTLPAAGGETLFADQYAAWDSLPSGLREKLRHRTILHGATGVPDATTTRHPLVRRHPVTGREALYLTAPARMSSVSDLGDLQSECILDVLLRHSTRPGRILRHRWTAGDIAIWDNRCTLHKADHSGVAGDRILHRGMTRGEVPIPA